MATCPTRAAPILTATTSPTAPPALPLWPDDTEIQFAELAAFQPQPFSVETFTVSRPPAAAMVSPVRLNEYTHGAAAWLTATVCEPTTMDPDRVEGTGFGATVYGTDASPCPPVSAAIDTQVASVLIDHVQSRDVAIASDPWPPAAAKDDGEVLTLTWHLSAVGDVSDVVVLLQANETAAPASPSATTMF
jgi:hypothetical protein